MPNILDEQVLILNEAAKGVPPIDGKRPHISSLWRWCRIGIRAGNGELVSLEYARLGRRIVTSREALSRFAQRLGEADAESGQRSPSAVSILRLSRNKGATASCAFVAL